MAFTAGRVAAALMLVFTLVSCGSDAPKGSGVWEVSDPFEVAGKPVEEGVSGLRPDAPEPTRLPENGDGGEIDRLAAMSLSDIEDFWAESYGDPLTGEFAPVNALHSWDSRFKRGDFCGSPTADSANAAWCGAKRKNCPSAADAACSPSYNTIGWDRGVYLAERRAAFGDMSIGLTMAHEYGHSIQFVMADLITGNSPTDSLIAEQQADCFAGVYMRWVADGNSTRFTLSTGEGLNQLMAARMAVGDPLLYESDPSVQEEELIHGSAFERVSAFQFGFTDGVPACANIDSDEIAQRRGELPEEFLQEGQTGEVAITQPAVRGFVAALTEMFDPASPPKVSFRARDCADATATPPASYCPATNTITLDMPKLILMGTSLSRGSPFGNQAKSVTGDYTAFSVVASRFMLALENDRGESLDDTDAGLRTACMTGAVTRRFANVVELSDGSRQQIAGGDLDEAVTGVLTNGLVASDVNGVAAPSGFARVDAFRTGVLGDEAACSERWP